MADIVHLIVEQGEGKGREISVPSGGVRLGRSSRNDIVLLDPLLSRHHCRIFFNAYGQLCVTDLGSANQTFVEEQPIQEKSLVAGNKIRVGDTVLKVLNAGNAPKAGETPPTPQTAAPVIDLGLTPKENRKAQNNRLSLRTLILLAGLMIILAVAAWLPKLLKTRPATKPRPVVPVVVEPLEDLSLEVFYEKVQATPENIFRYYLQITRDGTLSVQIDDMANNRHVREEGEINTEYAETLARSLRDSGFFLLSPEYQGILPDILDRWDLSITVGQSTHTTRVINRVPPDAFQAVCKQIEECGKNILGLWAIQFSAETLTEMAREAWLLGKNLFDQREIKFGNLSTAIKSLTEAEWYLETVEPKPDFHPDILLVLADSKEDLQKKFDDRNFLAQRGIRMSEWEAAARELRIICELIPDRSDPRNKKAREDLVYVESNLKKK